MKFNLEPSKSKELSGTYLVERRFGRMAVTTLLLIGLCFASVLSAVIVMAAVQQRQGIFFKDFVNWRDVAGGIQVDNTRVSFLTLAKPCDTHRASCAANRTRDIQPVLPKTEFPHYAVCGHRWYGLSLLDYAFLSEMAYFETDSDMSGYLAAVLSQKQVVIQGVFEKPRKWFHLDVHHCAEGWPSLGNESQCKVLSVVAISGTDPTLVTDYAENLRMWTEPVALQILSTLFPTVRIWPRDTSAMVIASIHSILEGLGLEDNQWQYQGILEYVRSLPESRDVVITGHSLGAGMALVIGALTNRLAVAIQPPGVYYSLAKHQFQQSSLAATSHLHQRSVSLIFEGDWVQHFDLHGGLVQTMMCDASEMNVQLGCHMLEGAICHLLRHCGDDAGRFEGCRHDYTPQHTVADVIQSGFAAVQGGVLSTFSNLRPSRDLNQFLIAGLAVSVVVLTRFIGTSSWLYASLGLPES